MTDPISFSSTSPRFALPLLFAGQSQKEVTVNEALLLADLLLHPVIAGTAASPPASPLAGQCWIVATGATGAFSGKDGQIAAWSEGGWRFIAARDGLRVFDGEHGGQMIFTGAAWHFVTAPAAPSGGTVVDVQMRATFATLVNALVTAGIFRIA